MKAGRPEGQINLLVEAFVDAILNANVNSCLRRYAVNEVNHPDRLLLPCSPGQDFLAPKARFDTIGSTHSH